MEKRNRTISIVKGIGIILVVLGHCIQCGSGSLYYNGAFYEDFVHKAICSFHMPLFVLVSGYLFWNTSNKYPVSAIIKKRVTNLLLPAFTWKTIDWTILFFTKHYTSIQTWLFDYIKAFIKGYWFIWAIIFCTVITCIIKVLFKDYWLVFILSIVLCPFIPQFVNSSVILFVYPFFVAGYLFNKYRLKTVTEIIRTHKKYILCLLIVLWGLLLTQYRRETYIYTSGINVLVSDSIMHQLVVDVYRWITALFGSVSCILFVSTVLDQKNQGGADKNNMLEIILSYLGDNSLVIYLTSSIITGGYLPGLTAEASPSILLNIVETSIIIIICCIINYLADRNYISKLFLKGVIPKEVMNHTRIFK